MAKTINISELKVGMYVQMSGAWHAHPFLSNSFTITSQQQIKKIANFGIKTIAIDERKGILAKEALKQDTKQPDKNFSHGLAAASEKLRETLDDKGMPTPQRAKLIHARDKRSNQAHLL